MLLIIFVADQFSCLPVVVADNKIEAAKPFSKINHTILFTGKETGVVLRADAAERLRLLESYLREQAAGKLGLAPSRVDVESPLHQLGVDSLVAVELRAQIERDLGIVVPVVRLLDGPSVTGLAGWLVERLSPATAEPEPVETDHVRTAQVNGGNGTDPQWMDVLGRLPDISDDDVDALLRDVLAAREGQDDG